MLLRVLALLLPLWPLFGLTNERSYEGYKIYDVLASNKLQQRYILRLSRNSSYDFFALSRVKAQSRVMVQPEEQAGFEAWLQARNIEYTILSQNLGESLKLSQLANREKLAVRKDRAYSIDFGAFHRHAAINAYLKEMAAAYPSRVSVQTVGQSFEGREMLAISIGNGDGRANKNVIFIDAGSHAREWIAPAVALYVIQQLVENFMANEALLKDYDWIVLPLVNPDGYEYTHTSTRLWRKTRKPVSGNCSGTDANRNFNFHWGQRGASSNPCSDTYMGPEAFSEPETQAVANLLHSLKGRGQFYLTLHSYGNYLLYPWGWTSALPRGWRQIHAVAQAGAAAIKAATDSDYMVGSSTNVLYAAAGGSDDYAYAMAKFPIALTMELPGGGSGFDPSPAQIQPFVEESWLGIKAMAQQVMNTSAPDDDESHQAALLPLDLGCLLLVNLIPMWGR